MIIDDFGLWLQYFDSENVKDFVVKMQIFGIIIMEVFVNYVYGLEVDIYYGFK